MSCHCMLPSWSLSKSVLCLLKPAFLHLKVVTEALLLRVGIATGEQAWASSSPVNSHPPEALEFVKRSRSSLPVICTVRRL